VARYDMTLEASHLNLSLAGTAIVRDLSLTLRPGELTALVGPNGAGKSTVLRMLAHLETRGHGTVSIRDLGRIGDLTPLERARCVGWVGDHGNLPFAFSVFETVRLGRYAWHQGIPTRLDDDLANAALARMDLSHLAHRDVTSLSSGERQKTMIARLLAGQTPVLLLDEPLANLDIGSSLKLMALLQSLTREGATVCLTIHDLSLAYRFADRVLCLQHGHLCGDGPAKTVLISPAITKAFGVTARIDPGLILTIDSET
jgi:iron complex transport system ATP-binding protein